MRIISFLILLSILGISEVQAQNKIRNKKADRLIGGRRPDGTRFEKFIGNVIFQTANATIYCDTATIAKKSNTLEATGHVRIVDGDSITITAHKLTYLGNEKIAKLRNNVEFKKKGQLQLNTNYLDYDRNTQMAYYFNNGTIKDTVNVLSSKKGYYNTRNNMASFKTNVVATNPDYVLESDTMQYNTNSKIVYFRDHTVLTNSDSSVFEYEAGSYYNTLQGKSDFSKGFLETEDYSLKGKRIVSDEIRKQYKVKGDVRLFAKKDEVIIEGQEAVMLKRTGITKIYGQAVMKKLVDQDTLYLYADTLVSIDSKIESEKRLLAFNNVRIFKEQMQGRADSLAYIFSDSIIHLYNKPILWSDENQITADSINIKLKNNGIDRLNMSINSFVVSKDTTQNFNQIKGRNMVARFKDGGIDKVFVTGNGETVYHALEEKTNLTMGVNKIQCSNMRIDFVKGQLNDITFYIEPTGKFIPIHELQNSDKKLSGFEWREDERPINPLDSNPLLLQEKPDTTEEPALKKKPTPKKEPKNKPRGFKKRN